MADRMLRHIPTGVLYVYQPVFATRPDFEEIFDVESRVVPEAEVEAAKPKRKPKPVVEPTDEAQISADASRNLP